MGLNLPNTISLLRLIIAPIFFLLLITGDSEFARIAVFLFIIGAFSDQIDGWLARKMNVVTSLGRFVDPLADKFLTIAAFLAFVMLDIIPLWMVLIIFLRDFSITFLRAYAESKDTYIVTSGSAKLKTTLQMIFISAILILLYVKHSELVSYSKGLIDEIIYSNYTYYSMLVLTLYTVWTLIEYLYNNRSLFSQKKVFKKS